MKRIGLDRFVGADLASVHDRKAGLSVEATREIDERPLKLRSIPVHDLNRADVQLLQPLQVEIEVYADEVIATIPELSLWSSEKSESDALLAIKAEVVRLWTELQQESEETLGKLPLMWKRILNRTITGVQA